ncbi:hypothetical protein ACQPZF_36140 [Actinosynnema sp. CS-041913]|uniref:hypothetical protein n=1 Tax=Actinosynnema sp. CS-041913 TaxID=3239917 RepID=UPI003D8A4348
MNASVWLAIAAMVISAASATIAGWQARNARIQADSARRQTAVAEQKLIEDRKERAEHRREAHWKSIQQVVEHAHCLTNSAESARAEYLRIGPQPEAGSELARQYMQITVSTQTLTILYGQNNRNSAIEEVSRHAATLYGTVLKAIERSTTTAFVFGSRSFLESKHKPAPFDFESEKLALHSAVNNLIEIASAELKQTDSSESADASDS